MSEQIKTITVDQLSEATSLNGLYVFGYASKNAVGKHSVKAPITLLKGNQGDAPVVGANGNWWISGKDTGKPARGQDGEVTTAQLKEALITDENLATEEANGLMSANDKKELNEIINYMTTDEEKYAAVIHFAFANDDIKQINEVCNFSGALNYKVKTKNTSSLGRRDVKTQSAQIDVLLTEKNDVMSLYLDDFYSLTIRQKTELIKGVAISSPKLTNPITIDLTGQKIANIDVSECYNLKSLQVPSSSVLFLNLANNKMLTHLGGWTCPTLERIILEGSKIEIITIDYCRLLNNITVANDMPNLTALKCSNCPEITLAVIEHIEVRWLSRIGKPAGALTINKSLYDTMPEATKLKFVNKNITIRFE